jgi:hypothetical protein
VKRVIQHRHKYARVCFLIGKKFFYSNGSNIPMRIKNHALHALHAFPALTLAASQARGNVWQKVLFKDFNVRPTARPPSARSATIIGATTHKYSERILRMGCPSSRRRRGAEKNPDKRGRVAGVIFLQLLRSN